MSQIQDSPLALQIRKYGMPEPDAIVLQSTFSLFLHEAEKWKAKAESIMVVVGDDRDGMRQAREARLALREIRINVEKRRKELKEESLRKGQAIDSVANFIKGVIEPLEEHLQQQEDFVKLQEEKRMAAMVEERSQKVRIYGFDPAVFDLKGMPEETFQTLLADCKDKDEAKRAADERAEKERIERERKEAEDREKMRVENERLKAEADKERAEREKVEAELRAKREQEERAEQDRLRAEREKAEQERRAALAPDRDKLVAFAAAIVATPLPEVSSPEARAILKNAVDQLALASQYVKSKAVNL